MYFKYKNLLQRLFSNLPKGELLNYLFQKHITRTLPPGNEKFLVKVHEAHQHYDYFTKYNKLKTKNNKYYEFGAGWNLVVPLSMTYLGFDVFCIDIRRLIIPSLIRDSLEKFEKNREVLPFKLDKITREEIRDGEIMDYLSRTHGINYTAPADARSTGFEENSFDFISSTATFEHIPKDDILLILKESYRILNKGGIISISIDYKDHWSYFDRNISIYNFLKYSSKEWKKYNPSLHYQNRLRHSDYLDLISKTNFEVVLDAPITPNDEDKKVMKTIQVSEEFQGYNRDELAIRGSEIVLRK